MLECVESLSVHMFYLDVAELNNSVGYVHTKTIVNANDSKRIFLSLSTRRRSSFTNLSTLECVFEFMHFR